VKRKFYIGFSKEAPRLIIHTRAVKWVFDTLSNQKEINPPMIRQVEP
jgi:hypothetical protein